MCEEENYKVYVHTLPNGKRYVGITKREVENRWKNGHGYKENKRFYNAIVKYGWENIEHNVLYEGLTEEEACEKEKELVALFNSNNENYGYNLTEGGKGALNYNKVNEPMPTLQQIYENGFLLKMFNNLIKMCDYQKIVETTTTINIDEKGNEIKSIVKKEKVIEPSIIAINIILDNYQNEKSLKPIIERIKKTKEQIDD